MFFAQGKLMRFLFFWIKNCKILSKWYKYMCTFTYHYQSGAEKCGPLPSHSAPYPDTDQCLARGLRSSILAWKVVKCHYYSRICPAALWKSPTEVVHASIIHSEGPVITVAFWRWQWAWQSQRRWPDPGPGWAGWCLSVLPATPARWQKKDIEVSGCNKVHTVFNGAEWLLKGIQSYQISLVGLPEHGHIQELLEHSFQIHQHYCG